MLRLAALRDSPIDLVFGALDFYAGFSSQTGYNYVVKFSQSAIIEETWLKLDLHLSISTYGLSLGYLCSWCCGFNALLWVWGEPIFSIFSSKLLRINYFFNFDFLWKVESWLRFAFFGLYNLSLLSWLTRETKCLDLLYSDCLWAYPTGEFSRKSFGLRALPN